MSTDHIILGIDPGTTILGYGVIRIVSKQISLVEMGVLRLQKYPDPFERLGLIYQKVDNLIGQFSPNEVAIEAPFFGKNVQSMLKLGRAQGVALASAFNRGLPVFEYSPRKIKQSITGTGSASKEQVSMMVLNLLKYNGTPESLDATDAVAAALCHYFQTDRPVSDSGVRSWEEFIRKNPGRVR
jgi:crossover junction endodeoxyribonuclease RuvC